MEKVNQPEVDQAENHPIMIFIVAVIFVVFIFSQFGDRGEEFVKECQSVLYKRDLLKDQIPGSMDVFTMEQMTSALERLEPPWSLDYEVFNPANRKIMVATCAVVGPKQARSFIASQFREKK
ncbi:hypothetical protein [Deinococcus humi]|uniref:Uncharacterized protein n=1 Tax=Deinococcus humi TaxID=662880 RepID=A0A7W8NF26_9DEIO|nr:hypothetical protein [Deinococcus humi]MBB5363976.1 hypothetical protein [Deinococcus humi]